MALLYNNYFGRLKVYEDTLCMVMALQSVDTTAAASQTNMLLPLHVIFQTLLGDHHTGLLAPIH